MTKIMECVPNFSEGKDPALMDKILAPFRTTKGVKLLDHQHDEDHNRMVVTAVGDPDALKTAVIKAVGIAVANIDMTKHKGQHPRMGAVDVVPFIPIRNVTMAEAVEVSRRVAAEVNKAYQVPVFLYEESQSDPARKNLADIRKGQFEGMPEKLKDPLWAPDVGNPGIHPTAGVMAIGARMPLVAFNVNLDTSDIDIADRIAKKVRHISGGFRYCKGIGVELKDRGQVQVSMNLTHFQKTAVYQVFELIRIEARRYGVRITGSELVGLVPMEALVDTVAYYLGLENFSMDQVLETRMG